jgi:hypothetical protein
MVGNLEFYAILRNNVPEAGEQLGVEILSPRQPDPERQSASSNQVCNRQGRNC